MRIIIALFLFPTWLSAQDCLECGMTNHPDSFTVGQEILDTSAYATCVYAIQIGAYHELIPATCGVWVRVDGELYKYYLPRFYSTKEEAYEDIDKVRESFPEAFVAPFRGLMMMRPKWVD